MHAKELRELLHERLNIVALIQRYIPLRQNGSRWVAPCPFHQETKPSFSVDETRGVYYCFGCQAKGDAVTFYAQINGISYREALAQLAEEVGLSLDKANPERERAALRTKRHKDDIAKVLAYAQNLFVEALTSAKADDVCRAYIAKRGLSQEICTNFGLGWSIDAWDALVTRLHQDAIPLGLAEEAGLIGKTKTGKAYDRFRGRLMFPITTFPNKVIAFGGRIVEAVEAPKYINSPETPLYHKGSHLYGLVQAAQAIRAKGYALLTEGYMDVLTLHQFGFANAVGVLGTSLTHEQIALLTTRFTSRLVLLFDGDPPGQKAALRACTMILPQGINCQVVLLPNPEDIDSLLRLPSGKERFEDLLAHAEDGFAFLAAHLQRQAPRDMLQETHAFLERVTDPELFSVLASKLASILNLSLDLLRDHQAHARAEAPQQLQSHSQTQAQPQPVVHHASQKNALSVLEKQVLLFAARHPDQGELLASLGGLSVLTSDAARSFFNKLQANDKESLTPHERELVEIWLAPPKGDEEAFAKEVSALTQAISTFQAQKDKDMLKALRTTATDGDFASDMAYLSAVQATLELRKTNILS